MGTLVFVLYKKSQRLSRPTISLFLKIEKEKISRIIDLYLGNTAYVAFFSAFTRFFRVFLMVWLENFRYRLEGQSILPLFQSKTPVASAKTPVASDKTPVASAKTPVALATFF